MKVKFTCSSCGAEITHACRTADGDDETVCPACSQTVLIPTVIVDQEADEKPFLPPELLPGLQLKGFKIERKLAVGGMSSIYIAHQESMQREVAVKVLPARKVRRPESVELFQNEVRLLAKLNHPNIVPAFETGYENGVYYLAMSWIQGESLEQKIAEGLLDTTEALGIALDVARALNYAWEEHHVIHCDIKPSNVMVDSFGNTKLLDLGISHSIKDNFKSDLICGTPYYMSPEQARGKDGLDFRADIYSLGATLYHALAGLPAAFGQVTIEAG